MTEDTTEVPAAPPAPSAAEPKPSTLVALRAAFNVWLLRRYVCVDGALSFTMVVADVNKVVGYTLATFQALGHETGPFAVACYVLNSHLSVWLRENTSKPLLRKAPPAAEKEGV